VAVFLVIGCLLSGGLFIGKTGLIEEKGVLNGPSPSLLSRAEGAELDQPTTVNAIDAEDVQGAELISGGTGEGSNDGVLPSNQGISGTYGAAIQDPGQPVGPSFDRSGTVVYEVQKGDTLSEIASYFGVSVNTIADANPSVKSGALKIGEKLTILPTSGVIYESQAGDTLGSISDEFGVSQDEIAQFNQSVNFGSLDPGTPIVIPGGTAENARLAADATLPNFNDQFTAPAQGNDNGLNITNSCGTPVVAAAEGLVVPDQNIPDVTGGWNGGYGNFVLIEHPFGDGVLTRYAYLQTVSVQIGDYVQQGQEIGLMGQTGAATGCELHFEVIGAQNPFAND